MSRVIRKGIVLALLVGCLSCVAGVLAGCSAESVPSDLSIRTAVGEVAYNGYTYKPTRRTVGIERMSPESLTYAGQGFPPGESPSAEAGTSGDSGLEVYAIAGVDPGEAIAVRFLAVSLSGKGAPYWLWMRYEREQ
jgi:hypothetical protein